jgi:1-deoxy-D-xylulose-5-phosphate synthase
MAVLEGIGEPADLRRLSAAQLDVLAQEIRELLVSSVSATGGHLGPNLGVVELTIAVHRVFSSPADPIVFDTGHQAYVHKMLTGRAGQFDTLRQPGGLSGYPSRAESPHDWVENSHASTSLSYADGLAKAMRLRGDADHRVVAVIGDGALTGGMAWEALNNIAASKDLPVVVVVNDNGMSYTPTVGGLADHLHQLRTDPRYEQALRTVKRLTHTPVVGRPLYEALHGVKKGVKDVVAPQGLFEDLGLKYLGPIDGHDRHAVESALRSARRYHGPVIVHCVTEKGRGYGQAERDEADRLHGPGPFDPRTGKPTATPRRTWTNVFSDEMVRLGSEHRDLVAITAAMLHPTGLKPFRDAFPDRCFDVGIAEQHAVTSAAGMAMAGLHPVVAVYATFLNRAFDQVLLDVALHRLGVTFVLDRAGVTGDDGASHNGMWDLSVMSVVPGIRVAAPRDGLRLAELLAEAVGVADAPTVVRYPKGRLPEDLDAIERVEGIDVLARHGERDVLVVGSGPMALVGVEVGSRLHAQGVGATVVDPRWVLPVSPALVELAAEHAYVLSIEDGGRSGGVGAAITQALADAGVTAPVHVAGLSQRFLDHGKRPQLLSEAGLEAQQLARHVVEAVAGLGSVESEVPEDVSDTPGVAGEQPGS